MTAYVTTLDPDRLDTEAAAFDHDAVCADADLGFCEGVLVERATADGDRTIVLCASHLAERDFLWSGIVPALRALAATEPVRKAG